MTTTISMSNGYFEEKKWEKLQIFIVSCLASPVYATMVRCLVNQTNMLQSQWTWCNICFIRFLCFFFFHLHLLHSFPSLELQSKKIEACNFTVNWLLTWDGFVIMWFWPDFFFGNIGLITLPGFGCMFFFCSTIVKVMRKGYWSRNWRTNFNISHFNVILFLLFQDLQTTGWKDHQQ